MLKVLGVLIGILATILGAYIAIKFMFVGGIDMIVDGVKSDEGDGWQIGWGILRIVFATTVFGLISFVGWAIAAAMITMSKD